MGHRKTMIDEMKDRGRLLVGFAHIEYPVYMLHLNLKKPNDDSMYFMDWAIIHFIKSQPNLQRNALAWALGMQMSMVEYRVKHLLDEGFITSKEKEYEVMPKADGYFFSDNDEVPIVNDSKDLLVDGITLQLMDPIFYEDYPYVQYNHDSNIPRKIMEDNDCYEVRKVLEKIEAMTDTNKQKYKLPKGSSDYVAVDDPGEGTIQLQVVFSIDEQGRVHKEIMHGTHRVKIPALNSEEGNSFLDKCCFYFLKDKLRFNEGFNTREAKEAAKQIMNFNKDGIGEIASQLFGWRNIEPERDYLYHYNETEKMARPLTYCVTYDMFCKTKYRRNLINALRMGYIRYPQNEKQFGVYLSVESDDTDMQKLKMFDAVVERYQKEDDIKGLVSYFEAHDASQCRKDLILLQRFDVLEEIDNERFIQKIDANE